jgi:hypothetical protein
MAARPYSTQAKGLERSRMKRNKQAGVEGVEGELTLVPAI